MIDNNEAVEQLGKWMMNELKSNEHKGDWKEFTNINGILGEIVHHHKKVEAALLSGDADKLREHIADTCNCYLFLANANNLFNTTMRDLKELNNNELKALESVHNALYFADNSDYQTALYEALCALLGTKWDDEASAYPSSKNFALIEEEMKLREANPTIREVKAAVSIEYKIKTAMGKLHFSELPFLSEAEKMEFDSIGYSGRTLSGVKTTRSEYLNSLNKGQFTVTCTKGDSGDFTEEFIITQE